MTKPKTVDAPVAAADPHPFAIELASGIVIDRAKMNAQPSDKMAPLLAAIYMKENARVVIVDNTRKFFGLESLLGALDNDDVNLDLILEQNKIELTADELATVKSATSIKSRIKTAVEAALAALIPPYPFQAVPEGWSVENNLTITPRGVERQNGSGYRIGMRILQQVWNRISPAWCGNTRIRDVDRMYLQNGGGHYTNWEMDRIAIGCQSIQRYELEQLALHQGWEFPKGKEPAA